MQTLDVYQIAKKYGLTDDQAKRLVYKHAEAPRPIAIVPNKSGGKGRPVFLQVDVERLLDKIARDNEAQPGEMDFDDIADLLNTSTTQAAYIFRTNPNAPQPVRISSERKKRFFCEKSVRAFAATLRHPKTKAGRKSSVHAGDDLTYAPAPQNPAFDTASARAFLRRPLLTLNRI